jgi:hypothetical protein
MSRIRSHSGAPLNEWRGACIASVWTIDSKEACRGVARTRRMSLGWVSLRRGLLRPALEETALRLRISVKKGLGLAYLLQNGLVVRDDINHRPVPGIERFKDLVDIENTWPLTLPEQISLAEMAVELATSCYAGALMLQAMGLGGFMFDGIDPFVMLGASSDPRAPGLGFRYDSEERWPYPNPTGLAGVMEGFCPPHYAEMRTAVEAMCERKFGAGGPFHPETPGPWKDTVRVRGAAEVHGERFRECVALQAQYIFDTFGKFPGTVPSIFTLMYLQAHHLDLEFYDRFYKPGAYLRTHAEHMQRWHRDT